MILKYFPSFTHFPIVKFLSNQTVFYTGINQITLEYVLGYRLQ